MTAGPHPGQYGPFAAEYEEHAAVAPYNALYDRPAVFELLGDVAGLRVLDAGCGPGLYAADLVGRGAEVLGCDASPEMIDLARARVGKDADLRVRRLEEPLDWIPDESVDRVVSALVYHYLNDRPAFLREAHRILRPGGAMVISTHHPAWDWRRLGGSYFAEEPYTETWSKGWDVTAWRMPLSVMTEEFTAAGFLIERLVEPLPEPAMAEEHPRDHEKLIATPAFVLFRLVKRSGAQPLK
jgi:SAM-dependent methyltransferase